MLIAKYTIRNDVYGTKTGIITTNEKSKIAMSYDELHYTTPIADYIMNAAANGNKTFICVSKEYELLEYTPSPIEYRYNKYRIEKVMYYKHEKKNPVIIMRNNCHCKACRNKYGFDSVKDLIIKVETVNKRIVEILVQHCKRCGKYFIDEESLKLYEKKYGVLFIEREWDDTQFDNKNQIYNDDSILSRYGYSAGENAPNDETRQSIMLRLINENICQKHEIMELLSRFITHRGERCYNAVNIWKRDLLFLNQYDWNNKRVESGYYLVQNKNVKHDKFK